MIIILRFFRKKKKNKTAVKMRGCSGSGNRVFFTAVESEGK